MKQSTSLFKGIFALPVSPFLEDGTFDEVSLASQVDFCVEAKVHGIATPLIAGEFYALSEDERLRLAEIVVKTVDSRIPVVIGVSGSSTPIAVKYAKHAQEIGANGIIALPPYIMPDTISGVYKYFEALDKVVNIPIIYQNPDPPFEPILPSEEIIRLANQIESVQYVKEEAPPPGPRLSYLVDEGKGRIKGVFGGQGGMWIINGLKRGACGIMPACHVVDVLVQVYNSYVDGDEQGARKIFNDLLPLFNLDGSGLWLQNAKAILVKRGIIKTPVLRVGNDIRLDKVDNEELDIALAKLKPWFTVT